MSRIILFIHSHGNGSAKASSNFLLSCAAKPSDTIVEAWPRESQDVTAGSGDNAVHYASSQGIAGVLGAFQHSSRFGELLEKHAELLVVSDLALGPLGPLPAELDAEEGRTQTLIPPESRRALTAPGTGSDEVAGPLAMEIGWLQVPVVLLQDSKFWSCVKEAAKRTEAEGGADPNWLSMNLLTDALESAGFPNLPLFSPQADQKQLFARALPEYLRAEIPLLPWALFTTDPIYLERWAVIPRTAWDYVNRASYPGSAFWSTVLQTVPPQTWYTNLALLDIYPDSPANYRNTLRTAVIAHVFYPDMLGEILSFAGNVPDPVELFVTTDTEEKKTELEASLREQSRFSKWEVRVAQTNQGRDISAFLLDCADVLSDPRFDIVVKLHSKLSAQDPSSVSSWFRDHLFENLLGSSDYATHIWQRFAEDPQLGMVFPPVIHMGVPTMGNGWTLNRQPAKEVAHRLRITVPFDEVTPLSPYGSMFIARRSALEPLVHAAFEASEFPEAENYHDGSLAHVLERLFSYVVYSAGYYARCVQRAELAAISATALQYKYDQVSRYLSPFAQYQRELLAANGGPMGGALIRRLIQRQLDARYPKIGHAAMSAWMGGKRLAGNVKRTLTR